MGEIQNDKELVGFCWDFFGVVICNSPTAPPRRENEVK